MLRVLSAALFSWLLIAPACSQTPSQAVPQQDKIILRSGHVTMCQPGKGCEEETIGGRKYFVLEDDGFLLKVASGIDQKHGYADVRITNQTGTVQQVDPANFRMEEAEPRLHRLSYVDPNRQQPAAPAEARPAKSDSARGLPPPDYWTSEEHAQEKQLQPVTLVHLNIPMLHASAIAPGATIFGRVYFDRPRRTTGVSVLVALPGALFEFPCNLAAESKSSKHRKHQPVAEDPEGQS